jgi:hypothetical protein
MKNKGEPTTFVRMWAKIVYNQNKIQLVYQLLQEYEIKQFTNKKE